MSNELRSYLMEQKDRKYNYIRDIIEKVLNTDNVNLQDSNGTTLLYFAMRENDYLLAELLCKNKADLNIVYSTYGFETILMKKVRERNIKGIELLMAHGADINVKDISGKTALDISKELGFTEITDYFINYNEKEKMITLNKNTKEILNRLVQAKTYEEIEDIINKTTDIINNATVFTDELARLMEMLLIVKKRLGLIRNKPSDIVRKIYFKEIKNLVDFIYLGTFNHKYSYPVYGLFGRDNTFIMAYYADNGRGGQSILNVKTRVLLDGAEEFSLDYLEDKVDEITDILGVETYVVDDYMLLGKRDNYNLDNLRDLMYRVNKYMQENPDFIEGLFAQIEERNARLKLEKN